MTDKLFAHFDTHLVALSLLIAVTASYLALELSARVAERGVSGRRWLIAGALTLGAGYWAAHFLALLGGEYSVTRSYSFITAAAALLVSIATSGALLGLTQASHWSRAKLAAGAALLGLGLAGMNYIGLGALGGVGPEHRDMAILSWSPGRVAGSFALAAGGALLLVAATFWMRNAVHVRRMLRRMAAAVPAGLALGLSFLLSMQAAQFPLETVLLVRPDLSRPWMGLAVSLATIGVLIVTLVVAVFNARLQEHTAGLERSLRAADQELKNIALQDPVTRLGNRRRFEANLRRACTNAAQEGHQVAVLFIGLDGFKAVNELFGHRTGDEILRTVGRRLTEDLRITDAMARLGGDEFVIMLEHVINVSAAETTAQRVLQTVSIPVGLADRDLNLSASIGISFFPHDGEHTRLIANADLAMQAAKRAGRGTYRFYSPEMDAGMREALLIQRDLRQALERGEFELFYQAKIDARSGRPTSTEALIRWNHPERGRVAPGDFIPIAEKSGLIVPIGNWVVHHAVAQMAQWRARGLAIPVAINLSGQHFQDPELPSIIEAALQANNVTADMLTIEITETAAMTDAEETLRVLSSLANIGVQISIDDFGTGYSSLSYLRRFHALQIKIDRSFIADIEESEDARSVIQAVINLAHALQRQVVAEGVETPEQAHYLRQHGCDELQGFLFSHPSPVEVIERYFKEPVKQSLA